MRADGTGTRRLTTERAITRPTWSPDGNRIAFARTVPGNSDIYAMNADGTNVTRLTFDTLREYTPAWSPDGSMIAFIRYSDAPAAGPPSPTHLTVMTADGSGRR